MRCWQEPPTLVGTCGECGRCTRVVRSEEDAPDVFVCTMDAPTDLYEVDPDDPVTSDDCAWFTPARTFGGWSR